MTCPKIRPIIGSILLFSIIALFLPIHLFAPQITLFGPIEFIRLNGEPATKTVTFDSPIYVKQGTITIYNGESNDKHRVTSGNVLFNGQPIMAPKDFKKKNPRLQQAVEINEHNTITVILRSKPGTHIAMWITAVVPEPQLEASIAPTEINAGETATLSWSSSFADEVFIDNTIGKVPSSGSLSISPASTTTYKVTAKGMGGSITKETTLTVIRDTTPPIIKINHPSSGATFDSLPIQIEAQFDDSESGIDANSIEVSLNSGSISSILTITADGIAGSIDDESLLRQGSNLIEISVSDNAGNRTSQNM